MITETRWSLRALAAAAAAATVFAIVLTYSRGALLGLALLALAYAITSRHRKVLVFVAVAVVALAMVLLPADLFERVTAGIESGSQLLGDGNISGDPAVIQRMSAMRAALRMFYDNPLFGIGPGQFSSTYQSYALAYNLDMWAPPAAHSLYLEIAAEQGVLGLAIFAALIVTALVLTGRAAGQFSARGAFGEASLVRALGYVIVGYLATAIFLHDAFPRFFWVFFALTVSSWQIASGNSAKNKPLSVELDYVQRTT
jgi:O-antigen ligase